MVKESNLNKSSLSPVRNVLLTVLEDHNFYKKLLEAVVPVGYMTSHYKREKKVDSFIMKFQVNVTQRQKSS